MRKVLWAVVWIVGTRAAAAIPADPTLSDLLKRQTQELSEAGQSGERAVLDRYLDADVVYTDEDGSISSKTDVLESTKAKSKIEHSITVAEWQLRVQGTVATATFVDVLKQTLFGRSVEFRYRSTETWLKKKPGWRLISSHTLALLQDPPQTSLSSMQLKDYVGRYHRVGDETLVDLAIDNDYLVPTVVGNAAGAAWTAELRDVFFTPGQPRIRRVFLRDAAGNVTGYSNRLEGRDVAMWAKVG
jgi:ketosteroid isomerase-like protein